MFNCFWGNSKKGEIFWNSLLFGNRGIDQGYFTPHGFYKGKLLYIMRRWVVADPKLIKDMDEFGPYRVICHSSDSFNRVCKKNIGLGADCQFYSESKIINKRGDEYIAIAELKIKAQEDFTKKFPVLGY